MPGTQGLKTNSSCTCPDHAETGQKCKHIYAVEHMLRGYPDAVELRTVADKPTRPTYRREWRRYNAAQTNEEWEFEPLLFDLCQTIPRTPHRRGRPPVPIGDAAFAAVSKVFLTKSARRVMPRLNLAYERGFLTKPVIFNTISAYLEKPQLSSILNDLLIKSSLPLAPIETVFAIDSTGVAGNRFVRWTDVKYRGMTEHVWAKVHLMCGVKTHIITAAVILDRTSSDLAQLKKLLHTTAENFTVRQVPPMRCTIRSGTKKRSPQSVRKHSSHSKEVTPESKVVCGAKSFVSGRTIGQISLNITTNDRTSRRLL